MARTIHPVMAAQIRAAARRVRTLEAKLTAAVAERDAVIAACHGPQDGGMSYNELAEIAGISYGRIRQIVADQATKEAVA